MFALMDLIQLKMPPDKVTKMANAIEHHMLSGDAGPDTSEIEVILTWLRFRIRKWEADHPETLAS
jgi:hypothetical protein